MNPALLSTTWLTRPRRSPASVVIEAAQERMSALFRGLLDGGGRNQSAQQRRYDLLLYGNAFHHAASGLRIDPRDVVMRRVAGVDHWVLRGRFEFVDTTGWFHIGSDTPVRPFWFWSTREQSRSVDPLDRILEAGA